MVTYLHDQTRKRRVPLGEVSSASAEDNVISADSNLAQVDKSLYAVPSPRAKVVLDEELQVEALPSAIPYIGFSGYPAATRWLCQEA